MITFLYFFLNNWYLTYRNCTYYNKACIWHPHSTWILWRTQCLSAFDEIVFALILLFLMLLFFLLIQGISFLLTLFSILNFLHSKPQKWIIWPEQVMNLEWWVQPPKKYSWQSQIITRSQLLKTELHAESDFFKLSNGLVQKIHEFQEYLANHYIIISEPPV